MEVLSQTKSEAIRDLNDRLRQTFVGGQIVVTAAFVELEAELKARVLSQIRAFSAFDDGNDPHHEHDMAFLDVEGERYFFKHDYYDRDMRMHSPDPADPQKTTRVLTIGLASDY